MEIYYQERRNFVKSEGDTFSTNLLDGRLMYDVKVKEVTKKIKEATSLKQTLEKKKKKL